jgi:hypothetical protein
MAPVSCAVVQLLPPPHTTAGVECSRGAVVLKREPQGCGRLTCIPSGPRISKQRGAISYIWSVEKFCYKYFAVLYAALTCKQDIFFLIPSIAPDKSGII